MRRLIPFAATLVLTAPAIAAAAEPPCLTAGEFAGLASYALPGVISGTTQRCTPSLAADAWLPKNGKLLSERYSARKDAAWPQARAAFLKLSGGSDKQAGDLLRSLPDESLRPLIDTMVEAVVAQGIPPSRCTTIDRLVRLVSPLPPENTAELIALAVGLGSKTGGGKVGKVSLCPA